MKKRMVLFGGLILLLLTACGNQSPAENRTEQLPSTEQETSVPTQTNAAAETIDQDLANLVWEEDPRATTSEETRPMQTERPNIPAATTPKQDHDAIKPVKPKPTEPTKPTEESKPAESTKPSEEPTEATQPSEEPTEPTEATKPSEGPTEPTAVTKPSEEPVETTEATQPPAEPTKPSGDSGAGNTSPEWTPPIL